MRVIILLIINLFIFHPVVFPQNIIMSGTIKDSQTGESLIGANVILVNTQTGVVTNNYGYFALKVASGKLIVSYSYIGYKTILDTLVVTTNITINKALQANSTDLSEVTVIQNLNLSNLNVSKNTLSPLQIKQMPGMTGEPDIIKSLQFLPGVQTANEGSNNLNVRGGGNDQNLILLDEAPVYNASHALGFYSVFNIDAIKNVTFYKGGFPAQYGGRLSSVVDITMKDGNNKKLELNGGIGLTASRLTIEGPIVKDKISFILSGRFSYVGLVANVLVGDLGKETFKIWGLRNFSTDNEISFFDLNAKINYNINKHNKVYISAYSGGDHFLSIALNNKNLMDWGNLTSTLRWNHVFKENIFSNSIIYFSKYHYSYNIEEDARNFTWKSSIKEIGLKHDLTFYLNSENTIKTGVSFVNHIFSPGVLEANSKKAAIKPTSLENKNTTESTIYISNDNKINDHLAINYGLRYTGFGIYGKANVYLYDYTMLNVVDTLYYSKGKLIKYYQGLEPRFSACYQLNKQSSIKISYNFVKQYLHLLSNSSVGLPTDSWTSPDYYIPPQSVNQYVIGYYRPLFKKAFNFSFEFYYKSLDKIIDYRDNADLFMNPQIETQILIGKGKSYGTEVLLEKKEGRLKGWIGYSFSETKYKINGINQDLWFHPRYDIRHNISFTANYVLTKRWTFSGNFKLTSGGYTTLPEGTFIYHSVAFPYFSSRNGYNLPLYHRLDLGASYSPKKNQKRKWQGQWDFSIYNVYSRKNIYALYLRSDPEVLSSNNLNYMYLFRAVPMITYNFKF